MSKEIVISHHGLVVLEEELEQLRTVKRKEVAEKIKVARSFGDLSENSEYDEAKNEQGFVESRIAELEAMLKNARVIDETDLSTETVGVGCMVKVLDSYGDEEVYSIVGSTEIDPQSNKISDESPVGSALMGKAVGDEASVNLPNGNSISFKILEISKQEFED